MLKAKQRSSSFCSNSNVRNLENIGSYGISCTFLHSRRSLEIHALKEDGMPESVMLQDWPQGYPEHFNQELADKWSQLLDLRTSVQKALELARQNKTIGHPLDASVTVYAEGTAFDALNALGEEGLAKLVIVSEAHIVNGLCASSRGCKRRRNRRSDSSCSI